MTNKREPDLQFERTFSAYANEGIEFYLDGECLEIHAWNVDSDTFGPIILSPDEIEQLRRLLNEHYSPNNAGGIQTNSSVDGVLPHGSVSKEGNSSTLPFTEKEDTSHTRTGGSERKSSTDD